MRVYYCDKCGIATEKTNLLRAISFKMELPSLRKSDGQYIKELMFCKSCYKDYLKAIEDFLSDGFAVQQRAAMTTGEQKLESESLDES